MQPLTMSREFLTPGIICIRLAGPLDISGVNEIALKFTAYTSTPRKPVIIDLSEVTLITSMGIGMLIGAAKALRPHNLPAALQARDVITGLRMGVEKRTALDHVVQKLNRVIHRSGLVSRFVSLVVGELHTDGGFFYINAGHPAPIWMSDSQLMKLQTSGMILGPRFDQNYKTGYIQMQSGDSLLFYTDGIIEHPSKEGIEFGIDRLTNCLQTGKNDSAESCIESIYEALSDYGGGETLRDDASVLLVKRST